MIHVNPVSNTFEKDLNLNFQDIDAHFRTLEKDIDQRFRGVDEHFHILEKDINDRFHKVDIQFEKVDARFGTLEASLQGINKQIKTLTWSMGVGFAIMTGMITLFGTLVLKIVQ